MEWFRSVDCYGLSLWYRQPNKMPHLIYRDIDRNKLAADETVAIRSLRIILLVSRKGCNFRAPNIVSSSFVQQSLQGLLTEAGPGD